MKVEVLPVRFRDGISLKLERFDSAIFTIETFSINEVCPVSIMLSFPSTSDKYQR